MKKIIPIFAIGMLALAACDKGSVSGTVIDPFNGKAVELPTVWVEGTVHNSQKIPGGLPDGNFKFEGIEPGTYTLRAGKGQYSTGRVEFTLSKDNFEVSQNVYIYSQKVTPGLYRTIEDSNAVKITNDWAIWQPTCKESGFVLRSKFVSEVENPKTKKKEKKDMKLPDPKDVPANSVALLYKIATSVSSPIEAVSYPVKNSLAKNHADCSGIDTKETLLIPDLDKGTKLQSGYKSENLYEVSLPLPSGKQFLAISQDGKQVGLYYLSVNAK
jgi:hypothetical protein